MIKKIIKKYDFIIPLAALVGAPLCEKFKKDAISTNLGTIKTLSKLVTKKNKIIYLTTNSGYGIGKKNKFCDEHSPLNPISLYGKTKKYRKKTNLRKPGNKMVENIFKKYLIIKNKSFMIGDNLSDK